MAEQDPFWSWTIEEVERFRSKTTESLWGCHEWQGWRNEKGYGRMKIGGRVWFTHRIAWGWVQDRTRRDYRAGLRRSK